MRERRTDPYCAHRFRVNCDVLPEVGFTEVRGLTVCVAERDPDDLSPGRRGGRNWRGRARRTPVEPPPGRRAIRSPTLELRRGLTDGLALWRWIESWVAGDVDPQDVRVCLLDDQGEPVRGWVCRGATPVRWAGPDLDARQATVATETLELAHDGIEAVTDLAECED